MAEIGLLADSTLARLTGRKLESPSTTAETERAARAADWLKWIAEARRPFARAATEAHSGLVLKRLAEEGTLIVSLGTEHGVTPGTELEVRRGPTLIARLEVTRAFDKKSLAQVVTRLKGSPRPGDVVKIMKPAGSTP